VVSTTRPTVEETAGRPALSRREIEVVELASLGMTNLLIAERLTVSVAAIKFHLASVYRKLGVCNRTEAVVAYLNLQPKDASGSRVKDNT
jgi:DNA-binding NarL/FixJ family response regulator